jgi:hypothetical protein
MLHSWKQPQIVPLACMNYHSFASATLAFIVQMVFNDLGSWTPQPHVGFNFPLQLGAPPNWSRCSTCPTWLQLNGRAYHSAPPSKDLHPHRYSNMLCCHDKPFFHQPSTKPSFQITTSNFRYISVKYGFLNHESYLRHLLCSICINYCHDFTPILCYTMENLVYRNHIALQLELQNK